MKKLPLENGRGVALVDDEDYEWLASSSWHLHSCGYAATETPTGTVLMHRLIAGTKDGLDTDHINLNKLDNRRSNLRSCTRSQNKANVGKRRTYAGRPPSSRYKGVSRYGASGWQASIRIDGRTRYLGHYAKEKDAARAYDAAARQLFGEFARPNFKAA